MMVLHQGGASVVSTSYNGLHSLVVVLKIRFHLVSVCFKARSSELYLLLLNWRVNNGLDEILVNAMKCKIL